jgi:hypothetical protein
MTDLAAIRTGLAANLASIAGNQISSYMLANPTPPAIHVYPADITYDLAMGRGLDEWIFTVQAFVAVVGDIGAQKTLDAYLAPSGSQSVKAAIEADLLLTKRLRDDGSVQTGQPAAASDVQVVSCTGYRVYAMEGRPPVLGAEWHVEVLATGT